MVLLLPLWLVWMFATFILRGIRNRNVIFIWGMYGTVSQNKRGVWREKGRVFLRCKYFKLSILPWILMLLIPLCSNNKIFVISTKSLAKLAVSLYSMRQIYWRHSCRAIQTSQIHVLVLQPTFGLMYVRTVCTKFSKRNSGSLLRLITFQFPICVYKKRNIHCCDIEKPTLNCLYLTDSNCIYNKI